MGNRIDKKVVQGGVFQNYTAYALDAQGNSMATYDLKMEGGVKKMMLSERMLYGSSRLGAENGPDAELLNGNVLVNASRFNQVVGESYRFREYFPTIERASNTTP